MLSVKLSHVFVLTVLRFSLCERRIIDGQKLRIPKTFMVYLTREDSSPREYETWVCGGAILNRWYILTSAACVEDVQNLYAIAGYKKYVPNSKIFADYCTKNMNKRIVYTCIPEAYGLVFDKLEEWSKLDIALAKVETAFAFTDRKYIKYCSYQPSSVKVNYNIELESAGTSATILGWGHLSKWREVNDTNDYNQEELRQGSVTIYPKEECMNYYVEPNLDKTIDSYMICAKDANSTIRRSIDTKIDKGNDAITSVLSTSNATRRRGICQNDHGGPLLIWSDNIEHVIGVASVFRVNSNSECTGPFLFTSTARNKDFIQCVLLDKQKEKKKQRRSICDKPAREMGFNIIRRYVSWVDHPERPTTAGEIEKVYKRPQIPISKYRG